MRVRLPERAAIQAEVSRTITWSRPASAGAPQRNCAMASVSSAMPASCRINDHGCRMRRRLAACAGCPAATQKRSVETTWRRRDRSNR